MEISKLGTHSVCPDMINPAGWSMDVGCRGFAFTRLLQALCSNVLGVDPDPTMEDPGIPGITYVQKALLSKPRESIPYAMWSTGEGNFCTEVKIPHYASSLSVPCITLQDLMAEHSVSTFEVIKLDCAGAEYELLVNWPGAVAKQISVEYHDFTGVYDKDTTQDYHDRIEAHLSQWYTAVQHEETHLLNDPKRPRNFWDSLYVLKEQE